MITLPQVLLGADLKNAFFSVFARRSFGCSANTQGVFENMPPSAFLTFAFRCSQFSYNRRYVSIHNHSKHRCLHPLSLSYVLVSIVLTSGSIIIVNVSMIVRLLGPVDFDR